MSINKSCSLAKDMQHCKDRDNASYRTNLDSPQGNPRVQFENRNSASYRIITS